jgi:hypothetical protein
MTNIPTSSELRRKAQDCRTEAHAFQTADIKANMLEIAAEYDRLAIRADEAEERQRLGASNAAGLTNWFR